jgi:hypothetical protein
MQIFTHPLINNSVQLFSNTKEKLTKHLKKTQLLHVFAKVLIRKNKCIKGLKCGIIMIISCINIEDKNVTRV